MNKRDKHGGIEGGLNKWKMSSEYWKRREKGNK